MRKIVLDLETKNSFRDVGRRDASALDLSLVGIYDSHDDSYKSFLQEELGELWPILENADSIIGFNTIGFDIPILNKYYAGNLLDIAQVDIMREIENNLGRRVSLNAVASGTLKAKKSGDGLQAIKWWREGKIDKIRKYCLDDVRITKEVYDHALKHGKLTVSYDNNPFDMSLNTTHWERPSEKVMAATLPF